jgi:GATA-binding protein
VGYDTTPLMSTATSAAASDPSSWNLLTTRTANTSTFAAAAAAAAASKHRFSPRGDTLDFSRQEANELLRGSVFSEWKDNAAAGDNAIESPEEMRREDPLGTQIWKLYSKTKTRLPNQERLENLTWRMMAMNLKRREQL